jgi:hypothetical protein
MRRQLRGTAEDHKKQAGMFLDLMVKEATKVGAALREGGCRKAYKGMLAAMGHMQTAATHSGQTGEPEYGKQWLTANLDAIDRFAVLTQAFRDRCVRYGYKKYRK